MAQDGKNSLVSQTENQTDPGDAKPGDFPAKGGMKHGQMAEGANQLSNAPDCPRTLEDGGWGASGVGTPSVWGKGGGHFKVETNKGESSEGSPSKVSVKYSVDLKSGQSVPNVADAHNVDA